LDQLEYQVSLEQTGTFNEEIRLEDNSGVLLDDELGDKILSEDESHGGSLQVENSVQGAGASYIVQETYKIDTIDENAMNDFFDSEDDTILDFTESNPFGDAGK
jgi:hypothetical protein